MRDFLQKHLPLGRGIARKFIVGILLFSSVITLIATGLQLYLDYSRDINSVEESLDQIETSHIEGIIQSIWVSNQRQLQIQLDGILKLPNMQYVEIRESEEHSISRGSLDTDNTLSRDYPLYYTYRGERISLGTMQVVVSLDGIYSRLWNKALVILASQTVKTFLVSGFIFLLFYSLIGRHLLTLVGYAESFDPNAPPEAFAFDRKKSDPPDELDQVVTSMNHMRSRLRAYVLELKESDEALRDSEEKLRKIISESPIGIIVYDDTGQVVEANESAAGMIGAKKEQVFKQNYHSIESWKKSELYDVALEAVHEKSPRRHQLVTDSSYGKLVHLDCHLVPYAVGGLMLMIMDISERLAAEEESLKNQSFLEKAQEVGSIGTWELDTKKNELLWTDENYRIFGLPIGTKLTYEMFLDCIHPDDREYVDREWKAAFDNKSYDIEHRLLVDGKIKWVREKAELEFNDKDECIRGIGVTQDITDRKQAEEALIDSEVYLANIINAIGDPVFVKDEQFRFVLVNDALCTFLGKARDELVGATGMEFLPKDQMDHFLEVDREILSSGEVKLTEEPITDGDSKIRTIVTKKSRYVDGQGAKFIVGVIRDITEHKQAEEEKDKLEQQFHQSQKMESVGRLAGGVAHDFNNQLTAITGFSEMISSSLGPNDPLSGDIEQVLAAADSAAQLTSQLLAFSRKQTINPVVVDINETVERSQKMLKRLIEEDIELVFVPDKALWRTKVDPGQLDQILVNLSVNARDAMPDGGKLTIETGNVSLDEEFCEVHQDTRPGDFVMLAVSDSGIGMGAEVLANIFEPFFTTKAKDEGTGLGLSTVYGIVKQHDGLIYAYSEPSQGTSFKIYLPRIDEEVVELVELATDSPVTGRETVLLVEDNDMVRQLGKRILERNGYRVLEAENGGSAYLECKKYEEEIHLLLTDVVMPKMNGNELYEQVASIRPGIKVLYMSGYTDNAIAHRGVLDEGTAFIQKPFKADALLQKVREVLDT
jgi:PAS domain S-box-containing protein